MYKGQGDLMQLYCAQLNKNRTLEKIYKARYFVWIYKGKNEKEEEESLHDNNFIYL